MNALRSALALGVFIAAGAAPARAECHFDPYEFFPDRNDHVEITAHTEANHGCGMAFQEGPGYHFTGASWVDAPPHGILAQTGPTKFFYRPFQDYRGQDSYSVKVCAIVQGRSGCSTLTYVVDVQ